MARTVSRKEKLDVALTLGFLALALIIVGIMGMAEHIELNHF
tara:strand:+ start:85 stop:210 length:126 start_codon:yes stop_codon:yes gene_type:complete